MEMNLEKVIEMAYDDIIDRDVKEKIIETEELEEKYEKFYEIITKNKTDEDFDEKWDLYLELADVAFGYAKSGFTAGMKVGLLLANDLKAVKI